MSKTQELIYTIPHPNDFALRRKGRVSPRFPPRASWENPWTFFCNETAASLKYPRPLVAVKGLSLFLSLAAECRRLKRVSGRADGNNIEIEREREWVSSRSDELGTTGREVWPLLPWNAISRDTWTARGRGDYRFHVRPVPVFIANACISAANRALARARQGRKRRSESDRTRRAGGKAMKVLLNSLIMRRSRRGTLTDPRAEISAINLAGQFRRENHHVAMAYMVARVVAGEDNLRPSARVLQAAVLTCGTCGGIFLHTCKTVGRFSSRRFNHFLNCLFVLLRQSMSYREINVTCSTRPFLIYVCILSLS